MIDEERTLKELGIDINMLTKGSSKEVWVICDHCGKSRGLPFYQAATNRKCLSCAQKGKPSGKNNGAWKGGITPKMDAIRKSDAYKNWRAAVFKRDNYTCRVCNEKGIPIDAHHIEPVRDHKNDLLIFDVNNGVTLCKDCHQKMSRREYEYVEMFRNILSDDTEHNNCGGVTQKPHKRCSTTRHTITSRTRRSSHLRLLCNTTFINDGV